jgi:hypothetical protein
MLLGALFGAVQRYLRYRAQLFNIESLDDCMLLDIGLNRWALSTAVWAHVKRASADAPLRS